MKKILLTSLLTAMASILISANADIAYDRKSPEMRKQVRKEKREERRWSWLHSVNVKTEARFYADFPDAREVSWREAAFAEASFDDNGVFKTAYYDSDNELVGTTMLVDYSVVPEKARQFIHKKYPGYEVKQVVLFDDNEINGTDMNLFSNPLEDADNYFPLLSNGKKEIILKVTMDGDVSFFKMKK